ncbi:MAG: hypothetical protein U5L76_03550 [Patescibacteria group bacterium]|nr:hypothetical protein [Patescibacteria group bacterium]
MENNKKSSKLIVIIIVVILVILGAMGVYFVLNKSEESNTNTNTSITNNSIANTNNTSDPYASLMKYDGSTWSVTSSDGKVDGRVGIKINKEWDYPIHVAYFYKVNDNLPKSEPTQVDLSSGYYYMANNVEKEKAGSEGMAGTFLDIYCNKETMVDILAMTSGLSEATDVYLDCPEIREPFKTTSTFYQAYGLHYNDQTFDINNVLKRDLLEVYDSAAFYKEDSETGGWGADDSEVIANSDPVVSYDLIFTEI